MIYRPAVEWVCEGCRSRVTETAQLAHIRNEPLADCYCGAEEWSADVIYV